MIEKCTIGNINNNMQFIGLIILVLIICIVFLYYIKISSDKNTKIVEKYNSPPLTKVVKAPYLDTKGGSPQIQSPLDSHKDTRYPTSNEKKISTATLRPCQVHFNEDGTSKYIYEDDWKEFDTLISDEDNSTYSVPFKKFGRDNNNNNNFVNFNETTKCFKKKDEFKNSLNTYKYMSNDLVNYYSDRYIEINVEEDNKFDKRVFMQMNFNKQPASANPDKYKTLALESICSYNYNKDLKIGNMKLYRVTIVPPSGTNANINNALITAIDYISINPADNSIYSVSSESETKNVLPELLVSNSSYFTIDTTGNIKYEIRKNPVTGDALQGVNVKMYKFNRNLDCTDDAIRSYETTDARFKAEDLINVTNYVSEIINSGNPFPSDVSVSNADKLILDDQNSGKVINGMSKEVLENSLKKLIIKNEYNTKDEFLQTIYYFICRLIILSNEQLVLDVLDLIKNNNAQTNNKKAFIESFDNISKFIQVHQLGTFDDIRKKNILDDISNAKSIVNHGIYLYNFTVVPQVISNAIPFTLENSFEFKKFTIDTPNKMLLFTEDTICDILLVGGGGAGGKNSGCEGGGGGGGGNVIHIKNFKLKAGINYKIEIGAGGKSLAGARDTIYGENGGDTKILTLDNSEYIIAKGGGGGGPGTPAYNTWGVANTNNGGSGGGGSAFGGGGGGGFYRGIEYKINGITLDYIQYGNNGGSATHVAGGGGGGGAGSAGGSPNGWSGGSGGNGINIPIFDNNYYGAGGGGSTGNGCLGAWDQPTGHPAGKGGTGGGGDGGMRASSNGKDGMPHTGSGGGGSSYAISGNGGSGILIIRIPKIPTRIPNTNKRELIINSKQTINFKDGLYFKIFNGYYWDNLKFTLDSNNKPRPADINNHPDGNVAVRSREGITTDIYNITGGTNGSVWAPHTGSWERYTVEWQGFFFAQITGNYQFHINSDDASHLWIGDGALTLDISKITINNGGLHGMAAVQGSAYLTAGFYYPIRILFGENYGGDDMIVHFAPPGRGWQTNGVGWYFHIPESKDLSADYKINLNSNNLLQKIKIKDKDVLVNINDSFNIQLLKNELYLITSYLNKTNIYKQELNDAKIYLHSGKSENQTIHTIKFDYDVICDILIVGGGGGGGSRHAGGGGGGAVNYNTDIQFKAGTYTIRVGNGGEGATNWGQGNKGYDSSIALGTTTLFLALGGGSGNHGHGTGSSNKDGGSGGGAGWGDVNSQGRAQSTNIPNKINGTDGCTGTHGGYEWNWGGGGGGGASTNYKCTNSSGWIAQAGNGGNGIEISISGIPTYYGGGGGGGTFNHGENRAGKGGLGGGGDGSVGYNNASNGLPNTGGGGGGGGFNGGHSSRGGKGGSGIVIIKLRAQSIYETTGDTIKITYDVNDDDAINLKNARENNNIISTSAVNYIEPFNRNNINNYKIGTKNTLTEYYKKFAFIIYSLEVGTISFNKGANLGIISTNEYEIYTKTENLMGFKRTIYAVMFYPSVNGDIFMTLSGYLNVFIYNKNIDPNYPGHQQIQDIYQDFTNHLAFMLQTKDSAINSIFGLDTYNDAVKVKINNRTSVTIDTTGLLQINGIKNDSMRDKLIKLQNIYNSVKNFNSQSATRRPTITLNSGKQIIDIVPSFTTGIVTYEKPSIKHPLSYYSTYKIQDVSNNYIYFRYPNQ